MADNHLYEKIGQLSAKLDAVHSDVVEIKKTVNGHEAIKNRVIGYAVAVGAFAGGVTGFIGKAVAGLFN